MKTVDDYVNQLPDSFKKTKQSNNYKLLAIAKSHVQDLQDDMDDVYEVLDIFKATGGTLDLYGVMYNQARGSLNDDQYRYIILNRAARYRVGGDCNGIIEALAVVFGVPASTFELVESVDPIKVEVKNLPYSILLEAGITGEQIEQIIQSMLPAGIPLAPINISGTFEFDSSADVLDNDKGFGDIDQTVGGYFGLLQASDVNVPV